MIRATLLVIFGMITAAAVQAQPKWIHIHSDNFELYSSANEHDSRDALNYFEQVRSYFLLQMGQPPSDPVPVYIVMFGSAKEYEPYKPTEFAAAFYKGSSDRDYIVMGKTGEETARAAVHEYVHLITKHAHLNFPIWLNEGIADLYSTLHVIGSNIEFGNPLPSRLIELRSEKWVPLKTILEVDEDSPYYSESKKAGTLYSEGWALTHMLATTKEYRPGFDKVQAGLRNGTGSVEVLEKVYGKPLAKIEDDLKFYVVGSSYNRLVQKAKLDASDQKWTAEPAEMFDVHLAQANLLDRPGSQGDAKNRLAELTRENGKRAEPWAGLGYISWRDGDQEKAVEQFGKAYELGDHSAKLLWDYGRLAEGRRPEQSQRAFSELIALEPQNVDARIELAAVRSNQKQYTEALAAVNDIKTATPAQAPRLFSIMANAQLQTGQLKEARSTAEKLNTYAKTDGDRGRAAEMLKYLDQVDQRNAAIAAAAARGGAVRAGNGQAQIATLPPRETDAPGDRPALRRDQPDDSTGRVVATPELLLAAEGPLVETGCGAVSTMILQTIAGRKTFVVLQPDRIVITGTPPELNCGPQAKPVSVRIRFTVSEDGKADGVVRAVQFPE